MPSKIKECAMDLIDLEDSIESFINTKCIITNNKKDFIRRGLLFEGYRAFCNSNSQRCKPRSTLFNRLADMNIVMSRRDGYDIYKGIQINTEDEDKDEFHFDKVNLKKKKKEVDSNCDTDSEPDSDSDEDDDDESITTPIKKLSSKNKDLISSVLLQK